MITDDEAEQLPVVKAVRALGLMRDALALLDQAGASLAMCRLQFAIDTLDPPASLVGEAIETPSDLDPAGSARPQH